MKKKKIFLVAFILIFMFITGCSNNKTEDILIEISTTTNNQTENSKLTQLENKAIKIAELCKDFYINADKVVQEYFPNDTVLSQSSIDCIEKFLYETGYPVIDSDEKYPEYLVNSDGLYNFWESVTNNTDAEQEIISVSESGGLYYRLFKYSNGEKLLHLIMIDWDDSNNAYVSYSESRDIIDWELSDNDNFYYQIYPSDMHYDNYVLIRLNPVDKELYDFNVKYIQFIGYQSNNMFLCDWSSSDYGDLCFNDLLEYLYRLQNNEYFDDDNYQSKNEPYWHYDIPAADFENTILPYFVISLDEFRKRTLYDDKNDVYPWQKVCCDNLVYYPSVESDVIGHKKNNDGTITLTVNARCNNDKTDCLFTHEVIIKVLDESNFKYLSNTITYTNADYDQPPSFPRLPPQRSNE